MDINVDPCREEKDIARQEAFFARSRASLTDAPHAGCRVCSKKATGVRDSIESVRMSVPDVGSLIMAGIAIPFSCAE